MFAVAVLTGTLDARGERDQGLPVGIIKSRVMGVHARATVNGESVDVSRFGKLEYWDRRRGHSRTRLTKPHRFLNGVMSATHRTDHPVVKDVDHLGGLPRVEPILLALSPAFVLAVAAIIANFLNMDLADVVAQLAAVGSLIAGGVGAM